LGALIRKNSAFVDWSEFIEQFCDSRESDLFANLKYGFIIRAWWKVGSRSRMTSPAAIVSVLLFALVFFGGRIKRIGSVLANIGDKSDAAFAHTFIIKSRETIFGSKESATETDCEPIWRSNESS
jgi:hypothetical protein